MLVLDKEKLYLLKETTKEYVEKGYKPILFNSFGKDSLAMLSILKENDFPLDEVVYIEVWFDEEINGEIPLHLDFIYKAEEKLKSLYGVQVKHIKSEKSFKDFFFTVKQKGKNKGKIYGFPYTIGAWCQSRLKQYAIDAYKKSIKKRIEYVGINYDETKRYLSLTNLTNSKSFKVAPLYELGIDGGGCMSICRERGLLSPIYEFSTQTRAGCWFCPKQPVRSLKFIYDNYPELWNKLLELEKFSPVDFKAANRTIDYFTRRFKQC